jgi:membrane protease YdiL (CAAX protease family)
MGSPLIAIIIGLIFVIRAIYFQTFRKIFILYFIMVFGYLIWKYISENILGIINLPLEQVKIISRFGLLGYILMFLVWHKIEKPENIFFRLGNSKEIIQIPLIWKGFNEIEWRFTLVFSLLWVCVAVLFSIKNELGYNIIFYGIIFSIVNALLEEFIWRGFVLARLIGITTEKIALIVSSMAFGLYHYSLNFPLWLCLVFAIGGFYMGGSAIKSKGLLSPVIMHFAVNIAFVSIGIIF